jgi:hypothetical protein
MLSRVLCSMVSKPISVNMVSMWAVVVSTFSIAWFVNSSCPTSSFSSAVLKVRMDRRLAIVCPAYRYDDTLINTNFEMPCSAIYGDNHCNLYPAPPALNSPRRVCPGAGRQRCHLNWACYYPISTLMVILLRVLY